MLILCPARKNAVIWILITRGRNENLYSIMIAGRKVRRWEPKIALVLFPYFKCIQKKLIENSHILMFIEVHYVEIFS